MSDAVIDASVAVKWVLDEEHSDRADRLLTDTITTGSALIGPPHLLTESTNVLYQRRRRSDPGLRISEADADLALADLLRFPLQLQDPPGLYATAFTFARTYGLRTIYDSLYVVLAQLLAVDLWTADQALLTSLGPAAPWVRFIGDYPLA